MVNPYSNKRAIQRETLRQAGLQDTQRSWSNYVGSAPIQGWVGTGAISSEARGYSDSPVYGPNTKNRYIGNDSFKLGSTAAQRDVMSSRFGSSPIMGYLGSPVAFTSFGERVGISPIARSRSPFEGLNMNSLTSFGEIPKFPYSFDY